MEVIRHTTKAGCVIEVEWVLESGRPIRVLRLPARNYGYSSQPAGLYYQFGTKQRVPQLGRLGLGAWYWDESMNGFIEIASLSGEIPREVEEL